MCESGTAPAERHGRGPQQAGRSGHSGGRGGRGMSRAPRPAAARCGAAVVIRVPSLVLLLAVVVSGTLEEERCRAGESLVQGDIIINGEYRKAEAFSL